jgi:molybdopterin adenylyltransferase
MHGPATMAPPSAEPVRAAVITISTSRAAGEGDDEGGDALAEFAASLGAELAGREVVPDDLDLISQRLVHWADAEGCDLVLTTGGTGFSPNDLTPEATRAVIEREAPGISEAMRAASRPHTRHWMLSRAVAGIRGTTLIVNFPGSPKSIGEAGEAIAAALPHALELVAGKRNAHH